MAKARLANDTKYDSLISSAATRYGLPVWLVKGIIAQESRFSEGAQRTEAALKDASIGLMQILSATAKSVGYYGTAEGLQLPAINIEYGCKFLSTLVARFPGDIPRAISAYNAGPGNAVRQPTDAQNNGFCLARDLNKTCVRWYRFRKGEFGNQPYVQDVLDYASNYGYTGEVPPTLGGIYDNNGKLIQGPRPGSAIGKPTPPVAAPALPTAPPPPPVIGTVASPPQPTASKVGTAGVVLIGAAVMGLLRSIFGRSR